MGIVAMHDLITRLPIKQLAQQPRGVESRPRVIYQMYGNPGGATAFRKRPPAHGGQFRPLPPPTQTLHQQQSLILSTAPLLTKVDMQRIQWLEYTTDACFPLRAGM
jgi:hypothetical protein